MTIITITDEQVEQAATTILNGLQQWDKTADLETLKTALISAIESRVEEFLGSPEDLIVGNQLLIDCPTTYTEVV